MSTDGTTLPKPSHVGDCPECHHKFPANRTCSGGLTACGGQREHCPLCPQPVPIYPVPPIDPPDDETPTDVIPPPPVVQISDEDMWGVVKARRSAIVTPLDDGPLFEKISGSANGIQIDAFARAGNATITIRAAGKTTNEMAAIVSAMIRATAAGQS